MIAIMLLPLMAFASPTVTISPGYTNLGVGQTLQYTAIVTGLTSKSVTWKINGITGGNATIGTISTSGLYKAPAAVPTVSTLVEAVGSDGKTMGVQYVNIEAAGPAILSVTPNPIPNGSYTITLKGSFQPGAMVQVDGGNMTTTYVNSTTITASGYHSSSAAGVFSVQNPGTLWGPSLSVPFVSSTPQTVSPSSATVVLGGDMQFSSSGATSWTCSAGTINSSGLYQAPAAMPASSTVTITVTGNNGSASATVTLVAPLVLTPKTVSLQPGATQQFSAPGATSWSAIYGTISSTGLYTAPQASSQTSDTVMATGPGGSATATVTLAAALAITPQTVSLQPGATQQFSAPGATAWSATYGTVSSTGLYTAPPASSAQASDVVTASGPTGSAQASVTILPPMPAIISAGSNGQLPLGVFSSTISGSGFTGQSIASLNGTALTTTLSGSSLNVSGFASQAGPGTLTVSNGGIVSAPYAVQVGVLNPLASPAAARRFLEQGAFGPTPSDANNVQQIGIPGWIAQQLAMPQISTANVSAVNYDNMPADFLANAVTNPDQLRQRVAFALSQIFVTSLETLIWNDNMVLYQNMLMNDAFSNYRQIMEDVTLSPAMGQYLNMVNNAKADPTTGSLANENYARELMQLFTIGVNQLNPDGTLQLDSSQQPIPTYSQFTVTEFARVWTGWTYAPAPGQQPQWNAYITSYGPMVPYPAEHDMGSKQLLNGYVSPAGISPQQDLENALDNIFNHPNVGPFVATQLIQKLVKSNPSPAYVGRVAAAFNNNGNNVRGDMQAVIIAILLDPEARANDEGGNDQPGDGHLQEPALFMAGMVRAFGGQMTLANYYSSDLATMGEDIYQPASVFNYYAPNYVVPGTALMGGEFEIFTPNNAIVRANEVANLFSQYSNPLQTNGPGTTIDLSPFLPLAANPTGLVNALDLTLTHGVMPTAMKSAIVTAVGNDTSGALHQVQTACFLILTSNYYNVWH